MWYNPIVLIIKYYTYTLGGVKEMTQTKIRKTKLQKDNDRMRFKFVMWHRRNFEPPYTKIEKRIGLKPFSISHWLKAERDLDREGLEKIESIL